ncbi:MAG: T9SS type A sorting domain-containing protein [Saprospiraceae bacterium]|nr:T9SS type A sorting domain-containing protein [Saprospiraceae bacterium]
MKYTIFTLFLCLIGYTNSAFALSVNKCVTYSCGCCCSQDAKPCCHPNGVPSAYPNRNIADLKRTYSKKNLAARSVGIVITETDITTLMNAGNSQQTFITNSVSDSIQMNIGIADAVNAQTWTISNDALALFTGTRQLDFVAAAAVPSSVSSLYPSAGVSHWAKETLTRGGVAYTGYQAMWLNTGSHIDLVGKAHVRNSDGIVFQNTGISGNVTNVDMALGDIFFTYSAYAEPDNTNFNNYSNGSITIDGYGTIATPYGTYDCLRASLTLESQLFDNATGFGVGMPETTYWVAWFTKEGFRFYARKPEENSSGTVYLKNLEMSRVVPTTVLPVELLNFSAKKTDNQQIRIDWETASEKDNATFEVQRATDGKDFKTIGTVKGKVNTTDKQTYSFLDETPSVGHNYYRLRQTDTDGNTTFSKIEYVWFSSDKGFLKLYPNPAHTTLTVECEKASDLHIVNALGQVVKTLYTLDTPNLQSHAIAISDLQNGIYFLKTTIDGVEQTIQFVKN